MTTGTALCRAAPADLAGLGLALEHDPLPIAMVEGPRHDFRLVNPAFCCLLGKSAEALIGQPFAEANPAMEACLAALDRVRRGGLPECHTERVRPEPQPLFWSFSLWPVLSEDGGIAGAMIRVAESETELSHRQTTAINEALMASAVRLQKHTATVEELNAQLELQIAERRRAEQALHEAQARLQAHSDGLERTVAGRTAELRASVGELEAFSYSLAHDLRAPIRAMRGFAELALEISRERIEPRAIEFLEKVMKAAMRMDSLIQDVLALSQVIRRPIALASLDVDALVTSLVQERPDLAPPRVEIKIEHPLLPMLGHEALLGQCLTNLLENAVKFVDLGIVPRVRVRTEARSGRIVRLWVEDEGIGIAAPSQEKIFEIFQQLNPGPQYEGSGIGLAIVRKAAQRMGGQVGVESELSQGSRFWLELPQGG